MERHLEELQARLEELTRELREVQRRLGVLEARETIDAPPAAPADRTSGTPSLVPQPEDSGAFAARVVIPLTGRTLVVLGGAYLLRAISDSEVIPPLAGVAAALAYAMWWLVQAGRAAGAGQRLSARFHAVAAVMIAYPLILETTARFGFLPPTAAAGALMLFSALGLAVAWRRGLIVVAWMVTLFTVATATYLLFSTGAFLPLTVALLALVVAVEALALRDRWLGLRWPPALGLDLAVAALVSGALRPEAAAEGQVVVPLAAAIAAALALPLVYLGSVAVRTLVREQLITPFEVFQGAAALIVGFGATVRAISFAGADPTAVGVAILLLGAACYTAAFASIDRRLGRGRNFYSYTTFAVLLILVGSYMLLERPTLALGWSALAVAAVGLGGRFGRITLRFHGAAYVAAAATASGLVGCAFDGLLAAATESWQPVTPVGIFVTLVGAGCYGVLVATPSQPQAQWFESLPQAIVAAVVVWSAAGLAAAWLSGPLVARSDPAADAAVVAAGRTAVLAALAVALAWAGRRWSLQELTWLVYPVLVGGGLKLLLEDLRYGQPLTLFVALALYGGALVITPRLIRKEP